MKKKKLSFDNHEHFCKKIKTGSKANASGRRLQNKTGCNTK